MALCKLRSNNPSPRKNQPQLPYMEDTGIQKRRTDVWTSNAEFLHLSAGDFEEHAHLLAGYFMQLGLQVGRGGGLLCRRAHLLCRRLRVNAGLHCHDSKPLDCTSWTTHPAMLRTLVMPVHAVAQVTALRTAISSVNAFSTAFLCPAVPPQTFVVLGTSLCGARSAFVLTTGVPLPPPGQPQAAAPALDLNPALLRLWNPVTGSVVSAKDVTGEMREVGGRGASARRAGTCTWPCVERYRGCRCTRPFTEGSSLDFKARSVCVKTQRG